MSKQREEGSWRDQMERAGGKRKRPARRRFLGTVVRAGFVAATLLAAAWPSTSQAATVSAMLKNRLLSVTDLPTGWSAAPTNSLKTLQVTRSPCLAGLKGASLVTTAFVEGVVPELAEALASGAQAGEAWQRFGAALAGCRKVTFVNKGTKEAGTVNHLALPRLGLSSSAYALALGSVGAQVRIDLVLFRTAAYYGYLSYSNFGSPLVATVTDFARAAVAKATNGSTARVPDSVSIASTPVKTVHTALDVVGYRSIGHGPALVMIEGYSARMEGWSPLLVDALAQRYRVVIFDNAGVGRTQSLPAPLSVDAMANQTAAFIDALHLGRTNVLGHSMGTAVAQALAVLHPSKVRRLILCAPYPGNGAVVLPREAVLDARNDPTAGFPADQIGAETIYNASIMSYPKAPSAPRATDIAQLHAFHRWWAGADRAGRLVAKIAVPTLLADGAADRLDPVVNSRLLARLIPGARLKLYPDAGHAFLFQDYAAFAALVESFLGRSKSS